MPDKTGKFKKSVEGFKKSFGTSLQNKKIFVSFSTTNKQALLTLAPFSQAVHELGGDLCCVGTGHDTDALQALQEVWRTVTDLNNKRENEKTKALQEFLTKTKEKFPDVEQLFAPPDIILEDSDAGFIGNITFGFDTDWYEEYREEELKQTAQKLWKDVYAIKQDERVGVGFELIPSTEYLGHPLQDYLDSYHITWAMVSACPGNPGLAASSSRQRMTQISERCSDLRATILGCELSKDVQQEPFISYNKLSSLLSLNRIKPIDASFSIHGKGYSGRHLFGDAWGYPSLNGKTRWKSPGQLLFKLDFFPQTKDEDRDPQARVAFTETLPIDVFIETNNIDWDQMRTRNHEVKTVLDRCEKVFVKGPKQESYTTDFEIGLVKPDGTRRWVRKSDTDVRTKINDEYEKSTGIRAGRMGNIPGGEAFTTPEYVKGTIVGDVVISLDQSYPLSKEHPFVIKSDENGYSVIDGPTREWEKLKEKKAQAWEMLQESKQKQTMPADLIELKEKNFNLIGEFAINTNPKAKLCDYLIVNEKIARMMHIALGSGYEPDRSTDYHVDIVFDAPRQQLDVWGVDKQGTEHWILKKGEFVI